MVQRAGDETDLESSLSAVFFSCVKHWVRGTVCNFLAVNVMYTQNEENTADHSISKI
jgi:hypothetical protein